MAGLEVSAKSKRSDHEWKTQLYQEQEGKIWPQEGNHILAQYDDHSIIVYQAYTHEIASYALEHQQFGGPLFSYSRMSWIKTNFLWMMYRCGWATKHNQEKVLAIRITREGFDTILSHALTGDDEKRLAKGQSDVRLQWDPDHHPSGSSVRRRAIQLGLRNEILAKYGKEWIIEIQDITEFVHQQYRNHVLTKEWDKLVVAKEDIYTVTNVDVARQIKVTNMDT